MMRLAPGQNVEPGSASNQHDSPLMEGDTQGGWGWFPCCTAPTGLEVQGHGIPTLKRGANEHCASGAGW
jgi:hypothetical protein